MSFRTPRRRISPRTRRRYKAIRNFLKRAIGTAAQPDIQIHSSIAVDVSDLKHTTYNVKFGKERILSEPNTKYQSSISVERDNRKTEDFSEIVLLDQERRQNKEVAANGDKNHNDTKVLYLTEMQLTGSDEQSESSLKCNEHKNRYSRSYTTSPRFSQLYYENTLYDYGDHRKRKIKNKSRQNISLDYSNLRKPKSHNQYKVTDPIFSSTSCHSLSVINPTYVHSNDGHRHPSHSREQRAKENYGTTHKSGNNKYKLNQPLIRDRDEIHYKFKTKSTDVELDKDFIADIIQRQYKPIKLFGRRESDIVSQFSAPICKDHERQSRYIREEIELCSSANENNVTRNHGISDMRSICDTRLYSNKKTHRHKHRNKYIDIYNDSTLYDVIPVKEKSSPKSRRKFEDENFVKCYTYRDVPPSPRTHRPKLNLQAQCLPDNEIYNYHMKTKRHYTNQNKQFDLESESNLSTERYIRNCGTNTHPKRKRSNRIKSFINPEDLYITNIQSATAETNDVSNNVVQDTETQYNVDKTDKALNEIKDILQTFLQEIKKESVSSTTENKSVTTTPKTNNNNNEKTQNNLNENSDLPPKSRRTDYSHSIGKCTIPSCIPPFNPCCYPIMPIYPMNCMQNPYVMPSGSLTCPMCPNSSREYPCHINSEHRNKSSRSDDILRNSKNNSLTEELIKEIYKCVIQKPVTPKNSEKENYDRQNSSGSYGTKPNVVTKHNAKVGTPRLKCHSKSCEAFGSKIISDVYIGRTDGTVSDTILKNISIDGTITHTPSDSVLTSNSAMTVVKKRNNKFRKILRTLGLLKKKKKEIPLSLTDSEGTVHETKAPFGQNIMNYLVHDQQFYDEHRLPPKYGHHYMDHQRHDPRNQRCNCPVPPMNTHYDPSQYHNPNNRPMNIDAKYFDHMNTRGHSHYTQQASPQGPLCLKEIEVKSIATQSDNKNKSFFRNLKKKMQNATLYQNVEEDYQNTCSTQTKNVPPVKPPPLPPWKKSWMPRQDMDPMDFSLGTQQRLAQGDMKLRNAVLKKLFYKRNPFSPRNLIVKTLLGKDKSSFGEPTGVFRPKMFF